ncbi:MAG: acyl-CoA thioesterase [Acidobacteriia bacterium]|nr:acyl-CoA thioesterase [Terriglobia bacterium]
MTTPAFRWPLRVQFVDTDASGRIHYTATLRHFETAEAEFMRHIGCPYDHIEDRDTAYPRVHVECDYLASMTYEDLVEIGVSVLRIGGKAFTLGFQVTHNGTVAARGNIVIAAMDRNTGKSKLLPEALLQSLRPHLTP